ncbi:TPA: hypothetical protein ACGPA2_000625, partial [Streptococcus suis]
SAFSNSLKRRLGIFLSLFGIAIFPQLLSIFLPFSENDRKGLLMIFAFCSWTVCIRRFLSYSS